MEIKEYDICSKFKRFSLINVDDKDITINETKIILYKFLPINTKGNSFQYSFYDIQNQYIASKQIQPIKKMNFKIFYDQKINNLEDCSQKIETIKNDDKNYDVKIFEANALGLYHLYKKIYFDLLKEVNFHLPKEELENILNEKEHLHFFYLFAKLRIFINFMINSKGEDINCFINLFNYFEKIYSQISEERDYKIFEKITLLMSFSALFTKFKKYEKFSQSNFYYLRVEQAEINSVINLAMNFLNKFIDNLNEESPSYFHLVEINSGFGYYKSTNISEKVFTFDMIDLINLQRHLKETLPKVISFFSFEKSNNLANTEQILGGISVNESKLLFQYKKFNFCLNQQNVKENHIKDVAMRLVENLMHESFGHSKFQLHSIFCIKQPCETPKKCFVDKTLKELVGVTQHPTENNVINILHDTKISDSGNYFESSFGKFPGYHVYTSTLLSILEHPGKLIDYPELFYDNKCLEKLQTYILFKYLYQEDRKNNLKFKEEKISEQINETNKEKIIQLEEDNENNNQMDKNKKKQIDTDSLEDLKLDQELDELNKIYYNLYAIKIPDIMDNKNSLIELISDNDIVKAFLEHKRFRPKDNNEIKDFNDGGKPKKKSKKGSKLYSKRYLLNKLSNVNLSDKAQKKYFDLYTKLVMKD